MKGAAPDVSSWGDLLKVGNSCTSISVRAWRHWLIQRSSLDVFEEVVPKAAFVFFEVLELRNHRWGWSRRFPGRGDVVKQNAGTLGFAASKELKPAVPPRFSTAHETAGAAARGPAAVDQAAALQGIQIALCITSIQHIPTKQSAETALSGRTSGTQGRVIRRSLNSSNNITICCWWCRLVSLTPIDHSGVKLLGWRCLRRRRYLGRIGRRWDVGAVGDASKVQVERGKLESRFGRAIDASRHGDKISRKLESLRSEPTR